MTQVPGSVILLSSLLWLLIIITLFFPPRDVSPRKSCCRCLAPSLVTLEHNALLLSTPSLEEVRQAVFGLSPDSAPDGFSGSFFTVCWDIIHQDLYSAVVDFFKNSQLKLLIYLAYTSSFVILIPKTAQASKLKEYRPISLGNFIYKVISRLFNDRLALILPLLISPEQGAFVKGRGILDVSLAQELTQDIDRHCSGRNVIFKLDMVKAYDRLEWDLIFAVLSRFGFHPRWINYVRAMFTDCWFSILLNGAVHH